MTIEIANTDQAAAWDGHEGDVWTEEADRYDRASHRVLARFAGAGLVGRTDRVLDVGCGTGRATREAARVASDGAVTGIDLSRRMLDLARSRSATEGLGNVTFVHGDAQVFPFEPGSFDLAMSSFGAMFFNDPVAAFSNIAGALAPSGRLALLAWRTLPENRWLVSLRGALAMGRDLGVPPPDAPSPFALADPDRVRRVLGEAGFDGVDLQAIDEPMVLGTDAGDAMAFARAMGLVEGLTADLEAEAKETAMTNLADLFQAHETPDGVLLDGAAWLVTATRR